MNYNSLIEIGSKANIILRFKADTEINGTLYKKGEPFLYLKDAIILVNYEKVDAIAETTKTLAAYSDIKPRSITVGSISLTRKLAALLAAYKGNVNEPYTVFRTLEADEDTIYLTDTVFPNTDFFVYDGNLERVEDVVYDEGSNTLTSENFTNSSNYLISFSSELSATKMDLHKPHTGYLEMEIQGTGNIDKTTKKVIMKFDKVNLNSIINFSFMQNDMINVPLEFHIIGDKGNYIFFED